MTDLRPASSAPAGYRFPREVIALAVRWYLRYGLSYRDVEELLAERGITVDHVTVYRWVQTFTSEFIDAARPARHSTGDRWFVDETYVKGRRTLDLCVPGGGSARSGDRRAGLDPPRRRRGTAVLRSRAACWTVAGRGDDRPGHRSTRVCSTSSSLARGTSSSSMRTTSSNLTTADSKPGCARCVD